MYETSKSLKISARGLFRGLTNTCVGEQKQLSRLRNSARKLPFHSPSQMFADHLNPPRLVATKIFL